MQVEPYNFLFHPMHKSHTDEVKGLSIVTSLILTVLTHGWYLLIVGAVHARECVVLNEKVEKGSSDAKTKDVFDKVFDPAPRKALSHSGFIGIPGLIQQQKQHLKALNDCAYRGLWKHIQRHTADPVSHFDWFMLPTTRASNSHGNKYRLSEDNVEELKANKNFMKNYRKGIILIGKSWGWDLKENEDITTDKQRWTGYKVRLGKMLQSLTEFGEPVKDLRENLIDFIEDRVDIDSLDDWIKAYLRPSSLKKDDPAA